MSARIFCFGGFCSAEETRDTPCISLRSFTFCFLIALAAFGFASQAKAVNTGNLGILPAYPDPQRSLTKVWFLFQVGRGENKKDAVKVINNSDETKVVKVYPVDAVNTNNGSFALLDESSPREGIGKWIRMAAETLEIPAKSAKLDPFEMAVPENAEVGDRIGGIVVQEVDPKNNMSGTGVNIVSRVGVRIYETVPGEIKKNFTINSFGWRLAPKEDRNWLRDILGFGKRTFFEAEVANAGNVRLAPDAKIEVRNIFDWKVFELKDENHRVVFPKGTEQEMLLWEGMPLMGRYKAILTISALAPDGSRLDPKTKEMAFWVFPWQFVFVIIALAFFSAIFFFIRKYLQKILRKTLPVYVVSEKENLRKIGKIFGLSWQKLAAINSLKKPYSLKKGDKLRIPIFSKKNEELGAGIAGKLQMPPDGWQKLKKTILARRIIMTTLLAVVLIGMIFSWQVSRKMGVSPHLQKNQVSKNDEGIKEESNQLTKTGALKKSAVSVSILAPSSTDPVSSQRLARKLELIGYKLEPVSSRRSEYSLTTVEYKTGEKEIAEMVRDDLGVSEPVNLVEKDGLEKDVIIWNFVPKNEFIEI